MERWKTRQFLEQDAVVSVSFHKALLRFSFLILVGFQGVDTDLNHTRKAWGTILLSNQSKLIITTESDTYNKFAMVRHTCFADT